VNLRLHRTLYGCGKCHSRVIETTSFQREVFTTHGLHINSRGKKKLTLLTAKNSGDKNVSGTSSIPVIPVQPPPPPSPIFSLKAKAQTCLKIADCSYQDFINQDRIVDSSNSLQIFHQDIRGLRSKTDGLIKSLETDNSNLDVCFSEHHREEQDLLHLTLPGYTFGSSICCQNLQKEGVCIFVLQDLHFSKINISHNCIEKD
jgi:hypothetical protein